MLCENEQYVPYTRQPHLPRLPKLEDGRYFVLLDVWERHITSNEDDSIREVALGGPDTATRSALIWQVKALKLQPDDTGDCDELLRDKLAVFRQPGQGELSARTGSEQESGDDCTVSPESRYRGTENQLYRVEIHGSEAAGSDATFVWSRDNSSMAFPIVRLSASEVEVKHLGKDGNTTLKQGNWVEVVDDNSAQLGLPGPLFEVDDVDPLDLIVRLKVPEAGEPPRAYDENSSLHPLLRRWDSPAAVGVTVADAPDEGWIPLEDGIEVKFHVRDKEEDSFKSGDYWLIPARTATGSIEWPQRGNPPNQEPRTMPPHGTTHHYAPLATISVNNEIESDPDCRCCFGPLRNRIPPQRAVDRTVWISPLNFVVSEGTPDWEALSISRGFSGNTIRLKSERTGDLRWIALPLTIPTDLKIKKLIVCYQVLNSRSFISQIRLSEQKEPPSATVIHDDPTDLTSTTPACYESNVGGLQSQKAITLGLRLNFGDASDHIDIGAIGVLLGS
jgi:hypothetical protein